MSALSGDGRVIRDEHGRAMAWLYACTNGLEFITVANPLYSPRLFLTFCSGVCLVLDDQIWRLIRRIRS